MNLFTQKLAALPPGRRVRFLHSTGQILEGIVTENDGIQALSIQVTSIATLRYEQIQLIEEYPAEPAPAQTAPIPDATPPSPAPSSPQSPPTPSVPSSSPIVAPTPSPVSSAASAPDPTPPATPTPTPAPKPVSAEPATPAPPDTPPTAPPPEPAPAAQAMPAVEIMRIPCQLEDISKAFGEMEKEEREALTQAYNMFQGFLKSKDVDKARQATRIATTQIKNQGWLYHTAANHFLGLMNLAHREYRAASEAFFYGNQTRHAYCAAYQGLSKFSASSQLYRRAIAFAVIALLDETPENPAEAMEVLRLASISYGNTAGIAYAIGHTPSDSIRTQLQALLQEIQSNTSQETQDATTSLIEFYLTEAQHAARTRAAQDKQAASVPAPETVPETEPDLTKDHIGYITTYNYFENKGGIEAADHLSYAFALSDISDASLRNQVSKITSSQFKPIRVVFKLTRKYGKYAAISIRRSIENGSNSSDEVGDATFTKANTYFTQKKYADAIKIYQTFLGDDTRWESAFAQMILCYQALRQEKHKPKSEQKLQELVDEYGGRQIYRIKTLEVLQQYYYKTRSYAMATKLLDQLLDRCPPEDVKTRLVYLHNRSLCYCNMGNYPAAIEDLLQWLAIVEEHELEELYFQRNTLVYIELAENYIKTRDYDSAEAYLRLADATDRKLALMQQLAKAKSSPAPVQPERSPAPDAPEPAAEEEEEVPDDPEALQAAYDAYGALPESDVVALDGQEILHTALHMQPDQLYCLLTYLHCAKDYAAIAKPDPDDALLTGQGIQAISDAFAYAFCNPLRQGAYSRDHLMAVFEVAQQHIPAIAPALFAASALYALFQTPAEPDYNLEDYAYVVEAYGPTQHAALLPLLRDLIQFQQQTGQGIDSFADYKRSNAAITAVAQRAQKHCTDIDMRNETAENHPQVRQVRQMLFSDPNSELRICLNIVAANDTGQYAHVAEIIANQFIRPGKAISGENLDQRKIGKYIDRYWDQAGAQLKKESHYLSKTHDKFLGVKRTSVVLTVRNMLANICEWLEMASHGNDSGQAHITACYNELAPRITQQLQDVIQSCEAKIATEGFDWGTESLRYAASELVAKITGTYDSTARTYFFIDFLRGEDILLKDTYLPELESTFWHMPKFQILHRIQRHATHPHPTLAERLAEILSNDEAKHNFRSARLIQAYGEAQEIQDITTLKELAQYQECRKQAKQRFETAYQGFDSDLKLCESYGTLSNNNGEKDAIMAASYSWYRITRLTGDYGFYNRLLAMILEDISSRAAKKGVLLQQKLEEIADKPEYDFGIFNKEMIEAKIREQNYTAAEFIMSRILQGDVDEIPDYAATPFAYFDKFMQEYSANYQVVSELGKNIDDTIVNYTAERDIETALFHLTQNAPKETKGGANLLKNWMPGGGPAKPDQLERLLSLLGFCPASIQPDDSVTDDAYLVVCRKQTGKVTYIHPIPAFGSKSEEEGFRVLCLYGKYDCPDLMDKFRKVNATAKHTLVLLDYALSESQRRLLARMLKEEKRFAKTYLVIDRVALFYLAKHYAESTIIRRMLAITLPFSYYQPFVESSSQDMPPELFTGREAELTSIESAEGANLVYGGRQLGKSALLKMAQHNIDQNSNGDRAVLIEEIKGRGAAESLGIVTQKLVLAGILDASCQCQTWIDLAGHIQRRLQDDDPATRIPYLLLMLDEADELIRTSIDTDDSPITALKSLPSDRFKFVMAGLHNVSRYNREMTHQNSNLIHLTPIQIKQFGRKEATKLLTYTLAYLGFRFNQDIIDNILASTYNYPGLIQLYCQKLLEAMKNEDYAGYSEFHTPNYEVTESHYKRVLSDKDFTNIVNDKLHASLFTEEKGHSNYHIIALILAYLSDMEPNERGYTSEDLLRVAQEYQITRITALHPEQFAELLSEMLDMNIIAAMGNAYHFSTDGFRKLLGSLDEVEASINEYKEEVCAT